MKKLSAVLSLVCITLALLLWFRIGFFSGPPLEARLDSIERKLDMVLGGSRPGSGTFAEADESPHAPSGPSDPELQPGCRLSAYLVTEASFKTPQQGPPLESMVDTGTAFTVGNFLATPSSKTFENHQVGVKWQGYLYFDKAGQYMFSGDFLRTNRGISGHKALITLADQKLLDFSDQISAPALYDIQISRPGMYQVEVWLGPAHAGYGHNEVSCKLQYRLEGASVFQEITPGSLYTKR